MQKKYNELEYCGLLWKRIFKVKWKITKLMNNPHRYDNPELMLEGLNTLLINLETSEQSY